jgi:SPOR domain
VAQYRLKACLAVASLALVIACKKDKDAAAVVEELPQASEAQNTDTSAVMQEEPALSQVGGSHSSKSGSSSHSSADAAGFVKNGRYVVQVSVFKSSHKAGLAVEKLAAQGYPAYVAEVEDPTPEMSGTWHRVRVGGFQTLSDARSFGENTLKPMGYDFWVDKKSMDNVGARGGESYSSPSYSSPSSSSSSSSGYTPEPTPEPSSTSITPSEPEAKTTPPAEDWNASSNPATPEPPAPSAVQGWETPSEPAATTTPGWGTPSGSTTPAPDATTPPADTGTVKLDDW